MSVVDFLRNHILNPVKQDFNNFTGGGAKSYLNNNVSLAIRQKLNQDNAVLNQGVRQARVDAFNSNPVLNFLGGGNTATQRGQELQNKLHLSSPLGAKIASSFVAGYGGQELRGPGKIPVEPIPSRIVPPETPKLPAKLETPVQTSTGLKASNPEISSVQDYIKNQVNAQKVAAQVEKGPAGQRVGGFIADVKRKLVDSTAPIEDTLFKAKKAGAKILPSQDITNQIDRVYRSRSLAAQFAKDNGLVDVIKQAPDLKSLDQYLIATHAPEVATKTGRNVALDAQLVKELGPTYQPLADKVVKYGQNLLDYATQSGLVGKETAASLKKQYPNYVPLNRIFNEVEQGVSKFSGTSGVASLSKQTVVQALKGSERAIQNPTESLLTKTLDAFNQGERNIAGQQLASYKDLPVFQGLIKEVPKGGTNPPHTFSYLDNGIKRTFETTPELAQAAKLLDKQQLGLIGKIFAFPVRIARIGITGLNIPFIGANLAKDQVSALINSDRALQTSVANPAVFLKALWNAVGHGAEYDNWIRAAGGGTSFDISREAPNITVGQLRSGRNVVSKVAYTVTHPGDLLRTAENIVARSEEMTRLQQFIGTRDSLLKQGMPATEANIAAAKQSREATVNFARSGDWGKALNSAFLYINAGIQGSRTLVRNLATRPIQTTAKIALTVFTPLAAITAWNMSDPKRLAAYNDIRDFEKENNLIIIPPNPVKDPKTNKWNVIKIPFSQEIANLTIPFRKGIEALHGADPPGFMDVTKSLIGSTTSLNVQSSNALVGQFTPQAVKPALEATLNKTLFTGQDTVPQSMANLPADMQVRPNTSGTARIVGKKLNTSPLKVEQFVKGTFGGLGSQALNASDTALSKAGVIPKDQVGGQSVIQGIKSRFNEAVGGQQADQLYKQIDQSKQNVQVRNKQIIAQLMKGDTSGLDGLTKQQKASLIRSAKTKDLTQGLSQTENAIFGTSKEEKLAILQSNPELADTVAKVISLENSIKTPSSGGSISLASSLKRSTGIPGLKLAKKRKGRKAKLYKAKTVKLPKPKTVTLKASNKYTPRKLRTRISSGLGKRRV